jgi:DNA polymerase II large subunit
MVGQLIIGLAPHTSAGIIGRIVGFSKTQCFFAHPYFHAACRRNCDGDEICFIMLMDALLNFSRQFLPDKRGGRTMDAPLVLTTRLNPEEVDDEVFNMDITDIYPISFYEATQEWKSPYDVQIRQVKDTLGKPEQYRGFLYTHPTENINAGCKVSSYKSLTTVFDKVQMQMELAEKIRAVDKQDMARIIIEKHFLKDIKGNLRRFSKQEFRCISCNQKYRRIPLVGRCNKCSGKLVLTVAEGTVSKYLEPSLGLAEKYSLPSYLKQTLDILKRGVDSVFGKEPTKQVGLKSFIEQE